MRVKEFENEGSVQIDIDFNLRSSKDLVLRDYLGRGIVHTSAAKQIPPEGEILLHKENNIFIATFHELSEKMKVPVINSSFQFITRKTPCVNEGIGRYMSTTEGFPFYSSPKGSTSSPGDASLTDGDNSFVRLSVPSFNSSLFLGDDDHVTTLLQLINLDLSDDHHSSTPIHSTSTCSSIKGRHKFLGMVLPCFRKE